MKLLSPISRGAIFKSATAFGMIALLAGSAGPMIGQSFAATQANLTLQGTISGSCALSGLSPTSTIGTFNQNSGSHVLSFTTTCNAPFKYTVVSANGALQNPTPPVVVAGTFVSNRGYDATIQINKTNDGSPGSGTPIQDVCTSAQLLGPTPSCAFTNSGSNVAIGTSSSITLAWAASANPLAAGTFSDTLTVNVSLQP